MNDDRARDLMKGLGDAVLPLDDERAAAAARARALPRIEASLRAAAGANARRARTRRIGVAIGIAAALVLGVASAAVLTRAANVAPAPSVAPSVGEADTTPPRPPSSDAPAPTAIVATPPDAPAASTPAGKPPSVDDEPVDDRPALRPRSTASARLSASAPSEASTLADQNRLLAAALDARRRGDDAKAIVSLNELLRKYPSSPLAQEARVERLRCLDRLGQRGAAADEARRYLSDYPDGFAREEAKGQALPSPSGRANKP